MKNISREESYFYIMLPLILCSLYYYPAQADDSSAGNNDSIIFEMHAINFGPGYSWGHGILHFENHDYSFSVSGGGAPAIGYSNLCVTGKITGLSHARDFDSTFWSVDAEATLGSGNFISVLENPKGVDMSLSAASHGYRASASISRLRFRLDQSLTPPIFSKICKEHFAK
ncbi:MAG: hypothetical protein LKE81_07835 [Acetobacter sp.]|jgi:hypothetical protein|nr:hypothetical protein [Acetobacter sp.]MCH4061312.1 hypothetical protein [Acetobacter sp.]MCH4088249.1 hypothetical protein [Acetobacter sp.]